MRKNTYYLILILFKAVQAEHHNVITFEPWQGRLGDQLWNICKCLMLSDKYSLPFIYKPFSYAEKFPIHQTKNNNTESKNKKTIKVTYNTDIEKNIEKSDIIFLTHFYTKSEPLLYNYCLAHQSFQKILKTYFSPIVTNEIIKLPHDKISIALHIRKGNKFDPPLSSLQEYSDHEVSYFIQNEEIRVSYENNQSKSNSSDRKFPLKFPPNQYYIDAIKKISELVNHQPLYIYLFTDHSNKKALIEKLKKQINLPNITWEEQKNNLNLEKTMFDDLAALTYFDSLVRSDSSFSKVGQLLGNFKIIVYPIHSIWETNKLIIDQVGIIAHDKKPFLPI